MRSTVLSAINRILKGVCVNCRLCFSTISKPFSSAKIFGHDVCYFECESCGYIQTEEPTWLDRAYTSPINPSDTGIMARNLSNVRIVMATLSLLGSRSGKVVDYAGGHGFLVRLLRDVGVDALWADPYTENLVARGFEYTGQQRVTLVTAFEAFEHFMNPVEEMQKLISIAPNILFTTDLAPTPTPMPSEWWYYGLDHGQHIGFYKVDTLQYLADRFGLYLLSDGSVHLFTRKKYPLYKWRLLRYIARFMFSALQAGLESKTWTDHLEISESRSNRIT